MSNISVTNFTPNFQETSYMKKYHWSSGLRNDVKNDTVEISEQNKNKKQLAKWKKVLIVGASVAAVVAFALSKGKAKPIKISKPPVNPLGLKPVRPQPIGSTATPINPEPTHLQKPVGTPMPVEPPKTTNSASGTVNQVFTPIKYKKAKTLEEAKVFAQSKLGINEFEVPDLETANQINYSLTKMYNKTEGVFNGFRNIKYQRIADDVNPAISNTSTCARTSSYYRSNVYQSSDLIINQNWFENAEQSIAMYLKEFENSGQIKTVADGVKKIELLTKYRYQDSLNRYYKLYQQGKLTPKAKVDFDSMLYYARNEENYILGSRESLVDFVKQELNKDMSLLSQSDYIVEAKNALKTIRRKNGRAAGRENFNRVNGFAGLDGAILHEGGHCLHNYKMHSDSKFMDLKNREMTDEDRIIAREVSAYATTKYSEFLQEVLSGILCGDKYSKNVMDLYKKLGGVIPTGVK